MPVHPEIKKILDFIPQSDSKQKSFQKNIEKCLMHLYYLLKNVCKYIQSKKETFPLLKRILPVRIYTPKEADSYPILIYFHGGAFMSGNIESHDEVVRPICKEVRL